MFYCLVGGRARQLWQIKLVNLFKIFGGEGQAALVNKLFVLVLLLIVGRMECQSVLSDRFPLFLCSKGGGQAFLADRNHCVFSNSLNDSLF